MQQNEIIWEKRMLVFERKSELTECGQTNAEKD